MSARTAADGAVTAGIDIGGTKTALVVTDGSERLYHSEVIATDQARLPEQLVALLRRAVSEEADGDGIEAVGVAAPGLIDAVAGTLTLALNLGARTVVLGAKIETELGLRCLVEHDARAAAIWLFERAVADGRPPRGLAYLSIGTGISAGVVVDGRPIRGAHGLAGEVGHIVADPAGPACACGLRGCLEALAAGPAIARRAAQAGATGAHTALPAMPSTDDVFRLAADGDAVAGQVVADVAGHLARAIRALALAYGVDQIVIGGGVAGAGDALHAPLLAAIAAERQASPLVDHAFAATTVELLSADRAIGARGAALLARRALADGQAAGIGGKGVVSRD